MRCACSWRPAVLGLQYGMTIGRDGDEGDESSRLAASRVVGRQLSAIYRKRRDRLRQLPHGRRLHRQQPERGCVVCLRPLLRRGRKRRHRAGLRLRRRGRARLASPAEPSTPTADVPSGCWCYVSVCESLHKGVYIRPPIPYNDISVVAESCAGIFPHGWKFHDLITSSPPLSRDARLAPLAPGPWARVFVCRAPET